jgi:hypothetical protein
MKHSSQTSKRSHAREKRPIWIINDQEMLALDLNDNPPKEWLEIFDIAMSLLQYRRTLDAPGSSERDSYEAKCFGQRETLQELNRRLRPFKSYPTVDILPNGKYHHEACADFDLPGDLPEFHLGFVHNILKLLWEDSLDRVRRCDCCGVWIAAKRKNQRFCGIQCRQRYFENRIGMHERRNEARRKCYKNLSGWTQQFLSSKSKG